MKLLQKPKDKDDILRKADIDIEGITREITSKIIETIGIDSIKSKIEQISRQIENLRVDEILKDLSSTENEHANLIPDTDIIEDKTESYGEASFITVNPITKMGIIHLDIEYKDKSGGIRGTDNLFTIPEDFPYLPVFKQEWKTDNDLDLAMVMLDEGYNIIQSGSLNSSERYVVTFTCFFSKQKKRL